MSYLIKDDCCSKVVLPEKKTSRIHYASAIRNLEKDIFSLTKNVESYMQSIKMIEQKIDYKRKQVKLLMEKRDAGKK